MKLCIATLIVACSSVCFAQENTTTVNRFEADIQKFEAADRQQPPQAGQVLFIGSSSIRKWDLTKSFPDLAALNRGFGGSEIADSIEFFERIVTPYHPRLIVMYAGDNDIGKGKSPIQVHADFLEFVAKMHEQLPETKLVFIAIKPSFKRWNLVHKVRAANALIAMECVEDETLTYLDIDGPMLDASGELRRMWFVDDGLHLSDAGYELWAELLRPHLGDEVKSRGA